MNGEFLYNLYLMGGLFVALTTVVWLFTAANRRATQQLAAEVKEVKADLKETKADLERDIRRVEKGVRRDIRRVDKSVRRVDKRLSREIRKTNQEAQKTNKSVWRLRVDMQVVKDRLNIGEDSRPVASAPVEADPEADLSASPDSVATGPVPGSPEPGSGVSAPVADDTVSRPVGSRVAAHRQGGAGAVPSGITAPLPAAEK